MTVCDRIKVLFSDYLDQTISLQQKQEVEAHLSNCIDCRQTLDQVQFLSARLQDVQTISTPATFDSDLRARIMGQQQSASGNFGVARNLGLGFSGVLVFAALTFFVMTTVNAPENGQLSGTGSTINKAKPAMRALAPSATPQLAAERTENDSLKNEPAHLDQKIQLVDQEKK